MKSKHFLLILLMSVASGSVPPFAKLALESFGPFTLVFVRFLAASAVMYFFLPKKELSLERLKQLKWVALIGAGNPAFLFLALQYVPSNIASFFYSFIPILSVGYLYLFRNQRVSNRQLFGFVAGLVGVIVISLATYNARESDDLFIGVALGLVAAAAFFIYGIRSKEIQRQNNASGVALAFYFSVVTTVVMLPFVGYEVAQSTALVSPDLSHVLATLYLGLISTGAQYLLLQKALHMMEAAYANLFIYIQPIIAALLALIVVGEPLTGALIIGGSLIISGAYLARQNSK